MAKFLRIKDSGNIFYKNKSLRLPVNIKITSEDQLDNLKTLMRFHGITKYEFFEKEETPFPVVGLTETSIKEKDKIVVEDEDILSLLEEYSRKE